MRKVFVFIAVALSVSCSAADVTRMVKNVNLEKEGICLRMRAPAGMYDEPFAISFGKYLHLMSGGKVRVEAFNVFTVGSFDKVEAGATEGVSNFLDPASKFKDSWYGVYLIRDDDRTFGRRFMLTNPRGEPDDPANFNEDSILLLPALDQKLIVWSSHEGHDDYTMEDLNRTFYFRPHAGSVKERIIVRDSRGREWLRINGWFDTIAAVTDTRRTSMGLFSSIRNYVGLPNDAVYAHVDPWHPIIIKGSVLTRYFPCGAQAFWAVAYFNGTSFTTRQGKRIDTWGSTDIRSVFEETFRELEIDCASKCGEKKN